MKTLLSGNEAFARGAYEAGVTVAAGYPGTPSTEILEDIAGKYATDIYCEWSPNEKVAFEVAAGAALTGARALVTMKHVGLNVAADPLMTLSYTGVVGGFVAVVADDPGQHSSQNEQDTRLFAKFAKVPLFDPSDSTEAKEYIRMAFELSEEYQVPVIVRSSTRVSHSRSLVEEAERQVLDRPIDFEKNPPRFVAIPAWAKGMRHRVEERMKVLTKAVSEHPANTILWQDKKVGIITSGVAYQYVRDVFPTASVLKLGLPFPFPDELIHKFADGVERLIVVEEVEDFIEEHVRVLGIPCIGKSILPRIGELSVDILEDRKAELSGVESFVPVAEPSPPKLPPLPPRPPVLCPGCPHRGIFYALGRFDVVVVGDIGCYSLGTLPPLNRMDTLLCMGAGISMAHGMDKAGNKRKVVGIVGDSTFFHSGITGLLDIAYNKGSSTIIVFDNRITAMTGHQDHPGTGRTLMGEATLEASIEAIARACGIKNVRTVHPHAQHEVFLVLTEAIESSEPWLIVSKAECPLHGRKALGPPMRVSVEGCRKCMLCLKLGCPGLERCGNTVQINPLLCAGCKLCKNLCPKGVIG